MATLKNSPKINAMIMLFFVGVALFVFNPCALAHIDVTVEQARDLIESTNGLIVVDVREPFEYCDDVGRIPGALNYPLSSGVLEDRYEELPIDGPILVVCRSGGRSNVAANFLDSKGFSTVYDMIRGMSAWEWETEPCKDDIDSETADSAETNTYVFLPDQSTVFQTGGIAGVHETYPVQGQFQLKVDVNSTVAAFGFVDAFLLSPVSSSPPQNLGELFNMAILVGEVLDDRTISFTGKADDGSKVLITVTMEDDLTYLVGETIPPPNSADFFLFSLEAVAQRQYSGGTGEPNNPYLIYTAEQMNKIGAEADDWDKGFKLMADIDLRSYSGTDFNIIGYWVDQDNNKPFSGIFYGNGHKISNFTYSSTDTDNIGIFGYVSGENAEIKDLDLIDPNINVHALTGWRVGSLVGRLEEGTISNCYVEGGSISGEFGIGGLVGINSGTITKCFSTGIVSGMRNVGGLVGINCYGTVTNCYSSNSVTGHYDNGGIVGWNWEGTIINCYSMSSVSGMWNVGGLVGDHFEGSIINCYATGSVSGEWFVGGLVGSTTLGEVTYSFWDIEKSGQVSSAGGMGKTTVEIQMASTFLDAGWDFVDETNNGTEDTWWIEEGQDYPRLWWELVSEN
ncbi:MAG: rhodanese-like domain-containing protein [Sedimentisphaerales bacterium]|nr:rhodanese-like domain-containing protein [Sedimentisphaerales bacterium]